MPKPTQKQKHRQRTRDASGRYENLTQCYGRCGRAVGQEYYSHPLTDSTGSDGKPWNDAALCLCAKCAEATQGMAKVEDFRAFAAANAAKRKA